MGVGGRHVSTHRGSEPPVCFSASVFLTSGHHVGNNRALPSQTQMSRAEGPAYLSCANCPCKTTAPCPPHMPRTVCPSCSFHSLLDTFVSVGCSATALGFVLSHQGVAATEQWHPASSSLTGSTPHLQRWFLASVKNASTLELSASQKQKSLSWYDFFPLHDLCRIAGYRSKTN